MTDQKHTKELFDKLDSIELLVNKITPLSLASAEDVSDGYVDCPLCDGEGSAEVKLFENIDGKAFTVGFFGIGDEHDDARKLWELLNKETLQELVVHAKISFDLRRQRDELREACSVLYDIKWQLENSEMDMSDISQFTNEIYHACDILTKTKGAV